MKPMTGGCQHSSDRLDCRTCVRHRFRCLCQRRTSLRATWKTGAGQGSRRGRTGSSPEARRRARLGRRRDPASAGAPARMPPNSSAASRTPTGMRAARAARPRSSRSRRSSRRRGSCLWAMPSMLDRARARPASSPADGHRQDDQTPRTHAGVARGLRVGANGPDLEAERRA